MYEKLRKGMEFGDYVLIQDLPLKYKEDISEGDGVTVEKCFYCDEIKDKVLYRYHNGSKKFDTEVIEEWGLTKKEAYSELLRCIELALDGGNMSKKSMKYFRKKEEY
jgi:hypothetical protein